MSIKSDTQGFDLSGKSAVIVGCGGLGTNAAVHLCGMGIGRLCLIDGDTVEARNLNRQFFYTPQDIGQPKCELLAARLSAYAPDCVLTAVRQVISAADDLSDFSDADIFIAAVDNLSARRVLNDFCRESGVPLVNGGIHGFFGTAYTYLPEQTPDLAQAGLLTAENPSPVSVSSTVGVIGALQAQLAAQLLCDDTTCAGRLYIFDNNEIHSLQIQ